MNSFHLHLCISCANFVRNENIQGKQANFTGQRGWRAVMPLTFLQDFSIEKKHKTSNYVKRGKIVILNTDICPMSCRVTG